MVDSPQADGDRGIRPLSPHMPPGDHAHVTGTGLFFFPIGGHWSPGVQRGHPSLDTACTRARATLLFLKNGKMTCFRFITRPEAHLMLRWRSPSGRSGPATIARCGVDFATAEHDKTRTIRRQSTPRDRVPRCALEDDTILTRTGAVCWMYVAAIRPQFRAVSVGRDRSGRQMRSAMVITLASTMHVRTRHKNAADRGGPSTSQALTTCL